MNCPRCSARALRGIDAAVSCYACGWEYVTPAELSAAKRHLAMDTNPETGRMRRLAAVHGGLKL